MPAQFVIKCFSNELVKVARLLEKIVRVLIVAQIRFLEFKVTGTTVFQDRCDQPFVRPDRRSPLFVRANVSGGREVDI